MKKYFHILFLVLIFVNSYAQITDEQIDKRVSDCIKYKDVRGNDSIYYQKLEKLKLLLDEYIAHNKPSEIYLIALGRYAYEIAPLNYNKSITLLEESIKLCRKYHFNNALALNLHNLGFIYEQNMQNNKAIEIFTKTNSIFKENEDWGAYGWNLIDIGNIYFGMGFLNQSLKYYNDALQVFSTHFDDKGYNDGAAVCFKNMGMVMSYLNNSDSALFYYYKSLNSRIKSEQFNNLSYSYSDIADEFVKMQIYDSAEYYYKKCITLEKKVGHTNKLIGALNNMSNFFIDRGRLEDGLRYQYECYNITKELNNNNLAAISENNLGLIYYRMNKLDSALIYLLSSYEKALKYGNVLNIYNSANNLINVYEKQEKYKLAIPYYKKIIELKDEEINSNSSKTALHFEIKEREKEKRYLEDKNKRQKDANWILATIIFFIVIILILIVFNRMQIQRYSNSLKKNLNALQDANVHLNRTYSIIAHDLKGPIGNTVAMLDIINSEEMDEDEKNKALKLIHKTLSNTYNLMLDLLSWSRLQEGELPLKLERLQLEQSINASLDLVSEMVKAKSISIKLGVSDNCYVFADKNTTQIIINNLLSNAIKFSYEGGEIRVNLISDSKYCTLIISDDGVGMNAQQLKNLFNKSVFNSSVGTKDEKGSGFGLKVVYDFVQLNKGYISVKSTVGKGTEFSVYFPIDIRPEH